MRNHFACGNFDPSIRGGSFKCGHQATLFGHSNALQWHGHHGHHGHGHHGHGHHRRHGPHGNRLHFHGPRGHGHHNHGPPCNIVHGHGSHDHGSHSSRMHCHRPHGHASHDNGYSCHRPHGFGPHPGNRTCQPNHFWNSISYQKRVLFGGPQQFRRRQCKERKQGCNRDHASFLNVTPRPHSV